jgi:hypothetical protein
MLSQVLGPRELHVRKSIKEKNVVRSVHKAPSLPLSAAAMEEPPPPLSAAEEGVEHKMKLLDMLKTGTGQDDPEIVMLVVIGYHGVVGVSGRAPLGQSGRLEDLMLLHLSAVLC